MILLLNIYKFNIYIPSFLALNFVYYLRFHSFIDNTYDLFRSIIKAATSIKLRLLNRLNHLKIQILWSVVGFQVFCARVEDEFPWRPQWYW